MVSGTTKNVLKIPYKWTSTYHSLIYLFIYLFIYVFIYLFMRDREREAETQAEEEAGSMRGARCGTRSRVSRIRPWAEGVLNHLATQASMCLT